MRQDQVKIAKQERQGLIKDLEKIHTQELILKARQADLGRFVQDDLSRVHLLYYFSLKNPFDLDSLFMIHFFSLSLLFHFFIYSPSNIVFPLLFVDV